MAVSREEIIEALKEMSLLEASELVKDIEETFGVSAAAPVAVAAAPAAGGEGAGAPGAGHRAVPQGLGRHLRRAAGGHARGLDPH